MSRVITFCVTLISLGLAAAGAYAAVAGGGGTLPWDAPLTTIQTDLSGTTASTIALIAVLGIFGYLIFGGELPVFLRSLVYVVLGVSVLVAGNTLFNNLGITGATVEGGETAYLIYGFMAGSSVTVLLIMLAGFIRRKLPKPGSAAAVDPRRSGD